MMRKKYWSKILDYCYQGYVFHCILTCLVQRSENCLFYHCMFIPTFVTTACFIIVPPMRLTHRLLALNFSGHSPFTTWPGLEFHENCQFVEYRITTLDAKLVTFRKLTLYAWTAFRCRKFLQNIALQTESCILVLLKRHRIVLKGMHFNLSRQFHNFFWIQFYHF